MPVSFSIKDVPDDLADRLRERARRNHRSLQGELRSILEEAAEASSPMTMDAIVEWTRRAGLSTAGDNARVVRKMRDARAGRTARAGAGKRSRGRRG
jgi:plasmid stability protein